MEKRVCVKIERYYNIKADTQEDIIALKEELTKSLGKRFMQVTEFEKGAVCPSANCAFVSSVVVDDESTRYNIIVAE